MTIAAATTKQPTIQAPLAPVPLASTQPVRVIVEKVPDEGHDYTSDAISGAIGLIGAAIGAWVGAKATAAIAKQQKVDDNRERDEVASQSIIRLINIVYTFTSNFVADVKEAEQKKASGDVEFVTAALKAYASYPPKLNMTGEDAYRAGRIGGGQLLNMIVDFDARFNSIVETLQIYRDLREQSFQRFKIVGVDGIAVTGELEGEEALKFKAELNSMDHIVEQTKMLADELRVDSYHAMIRAFEGIVDYFGKAKSLTLPDLDGNEQVIELRPTIKK